MKEGFAVKKHVYALMVLCLLAALALCTMPLNAQAAEVVDSGTCGDNLTWILNSEGVLVISGTGSMDDFLLEGPWGDRPVHVYIEEGVTSIGNWGFSGCEQLLDVSIPISVTRIGAFAFQNCSSLIKINLPNRIACLEDGVFSGCKELTEIIIPSSVSSIASKAFSGCWNLETIVMPEDIKTVSHYTFENCRSLKTITLPETVTSIKEGAFWMCTSLTDIIIPKNMTEIGTQSFYGCESLRSVFMTENVTKIGLGSFSYCDSLSLVLYTGAEEQWESINISILNENLLDARVIFNYTPGVACDNKSQEIIGKDANCTEDGLTNGSICALCGEVLVKQEVIPATGHDWDEGTVTQEPKEEIEGEKTYTCITCGETKTEILPKLEHMHSYEAVVTAPSCTEQGYTTHACACGDSYVDAYVDVLDHSYGNWLIEDEPVDGVGKKYRICECGETERAEFEMPLTDVPNGKYYSKPVFWAYENGITKGKTATEFQLDVECTRKQIVMFLWRAAGEPEPQSMENPFTDVKADSFQKAILWAVENGITNGTSKTEFSPEKACTRKQIVTFLYRYFGEPELTGEQKVNPFTDVKQDQFTNAILWAYYNGITTGKTVTTFEPESTCTRGQIVTFLYRSMAEE